jgi:ubiquitin C-terminal hydrolase
MKNLGETCYLSTLLQTLHNNESFRSLISDNNKFKFKDTTGMPDFSFLPPEEVASELDQNEITAYRQQKLLNIRLLIYKLQKLFNTLDTGGVQLSARETKTVLDRIAALDPRWENRSEESAQLLGLFIDYLGMACDSSRATGRGELQRLSDQQEASNNQGIRIWDAALDVRMYWSAFCGEGHESVVTDMFISQVIKEVRCAQEDCFVVSRGFEHLFIEHLDFPRGCGAEDEFNLEELLDIWKHERLDDQDGGHKCEHVPDHPQSFEAHRRFSKPGQNICFAFRRGPLSEGEIHYANPVTLPLILDLAPYSELDGLPSRWGEAVPAEIPKLEYDLVSVNNWKSGHYIGYALVKIQNEEKWVMFNDLRGVPVNKTPYEGHAEVSNRLV